MTKFDVFNKIRSKKRNILSIIIGGILLILIITNPSNSSFEKYLNIKGYETQNFTMQHTFAGELYSKRTNNSFGRSSQYFVFSIFEYTNKNRDVSFHKKYIGILGNFFEL